jgi:hypothetical protein
VASTFPQDQERPVTRWTWDAIATTVRDPLHPDPLSRASIGRILPDVELKPHKSAYWLHSPDEDFDAKAHPRWPLSGKALKAYEQGRLVSCCDEKTGMHVLERKAPTKPAPPGRRERREPEYLRHGPRVVPGSL